MPTSTPTRCTSTPPISAPKQERVMLSGSTFHKRQAATENYMLYKVALSTGTEKREAVIVEQSYRKWNT